MSCGITKGSCSQPSSFLVSATSSSPNAAPWQSCEPDLFGDPLPIIVLQQINVGLSETDLASWIALSIASKSWPSTSLTTCQPYDSNRPAVSSVYQPSMCPSIEMPLSSQKAISLPKPQVPASAHVS